METYPKYIVASFAKRCKTKEKKIDTQPGVSRYYTKRSDGYSMANEATINGVHVHDVQLGRVTRKSFARIPEILDMPNLIEIQKKS